ncbi:MAG: hypothetical protein U0133_06455 [Gemmatimonadales bacterium]
MSVSSCISALMRPGVILGVLYYVAVPPAFSQAASDCRPASGDAPALLDRGIATTGMRRLGRPALGLRVSEMVSQDYQSDRPYPPFLQEGHSATLWYFPESGLETTPGEALDPFGPRPMFAAWSSARGSWMARAGQWLPVPALHRFISVTRPLNAWAVLAEWRTDSTVRVTGRCTVRDFSRVRLTRTGPLGEERLYLEPASGLPIQYERGEDDPHQLWGRQAVAYVYSNWFTAGAGLYPMSSFRLVDGAVQISRTVASLPADSAPPQAPALADTIDMRRAAAAPEPRPDTVRIGATTVVLRTRFYRNVVTLARDTIFLLDAQYSGEARARNDSAWIATLFPGRHPVVLVVSDLAWPHIAGVRSWVAMGATVVAHRSARPFLEQVIARRWREAPDLLERRRAQAKFRFVAVDDSLSLGGGAVRVYPINGIGSEGSLMSWIPADRFLFPGDYVQGLEGPSMAYAAEVVAATRRVGVTPERFAAMHMNVTPWADLEAALRPSSTN